MANTPTLPAEPTCNNCGLVIDHFTVAADASAVAKPCGHSDGFTVEPTFERGVVIAIAQAAGSSTSAVEVYEALDSAPGSLGTDP